MAPTAQSPAGRLGAGLAMGQAHATGRLRAIHSNTSGTAASGLARAAVAALRRRIQTLQAATPASAHTMELRIDVAPSSDGVELELQAAQERFRQRLRGQCKLLPLGIDGLCFWHREADAEHYVYVESTRERRLVGCVVLNRLVEVSRSLDPHVRSPHTRIAPAFQGRGIATAVYRWALDAGLCLVSGARQSAGAHALWRALGRRYHLAYVQVVDKELRLLGPTAPSSVRGHLQTRLMLFGVNAQAQRVR